ncbi:G-patch domain-containing protein [Pseudozyma hubeiensis]|nr:G-patch domain-containing protein [Pseudozyma hubeiensis]
MMHTPTRLGLSRKPSREAISPGRDQDCLGGNGHDPSLVSHRSSIHDQDGSSSRASRMTTSSSWTPSARVGAQPHRYMDRDDPTNEANRGDIPPYHRHDRRRSRSPQMRQPTSHPDDVPARSVAWKDLRAPRKDQDDRSSGAATSQASSSRSMPSKPPATAINKRFADDINRWNRKQSELHASQPSASAVIVSSTPDSSADPKANIQPSSNTNESQSSTALASAELSDIELTNYDYKDFERVACLLCQRKFKSLDMLHRHESESKLHKDNLASTQACRQAVARKLECVADRSAQPDDFRKTLPPERVPAASEQVQQPTAAPTYRDRASERRAVFGADNPAHATGSSHRIKTFAGPEATTSTTGSNEVLPQSAPAKPIESDNIGNKLLAMMGWSQGQGLGLNREGRTEIVETKIYKPGAGLGSSTPSDRVTSVRSNVSFTGYKDRAKDRARQRLADQTLVPQ